jgi:hypothetical protein
MELYRRPVDLYVAGFVGTPQPQDAAHTGPHPLLIRRHDTTGELAYLRCYSLHCVPLRDLVRWPGSAGGSRSRSKQPRN